MEIDKKKEIKEEIYKCSKCGLCQTVCPIYKATKNEMYLPRGRYIILNNFYNNSKPISKKFIQNLDICLNCNLCKDFCPSNIDTTQISTYLKNKYNFSKRRIPTHIIFKIFLHYIKFKKFFSKSKFYRVRVLRKSNKKSEGRKVIFFQGCFNKYINPTDKNATINLLEEIGFSISKITSECCGAPYLSDGNYKSFIKNAHKIINKIDNDTEYIVCSCDTCFYTLKKIIKFIPNAQAFDEKLIKLDDLLEKEKYNIPTFQNTTYLKPLTKKETIFRNSNLKYNTELIPSFFENFFYLRHPILFNKIKKEYKAETENIKNKNTFTTCNLTKLGYHITYKQDILSLSKYLENFMIK